MAANLDAASVQISWDDTRGPATARRCREDGEQVN